jgi:hypothetical protein
MPRSSHTRKGVSRRKQRASTPPEVRCRFCDRKRGTGHTIGCIGLESERLNLPDCANVWATKGGR